MWNVLLSTTILASFVGGMIALLAPCCVSVMLPAYFASTFRRRHRILAMTLVFAVGVATIILPIALGAAGVSRLLVGYHSVVFTLGGALMVIGGLAMLAGWTATLPMPGFRARTTTGGVGATYSLGVFSGIASSCCAPVLAGVAAVSGAAQSFGGALAVGVAYVFGMVAPLCLLAMLWDRRDWGSSMLLAKRMIPLRVGQFRRDIPLWTLISGGLLSAMGVLTIVFAFTGPSMSADGWPARFAAWLRHLTARLLAVADVAPGWVWSLLVVVALGAIVILAVRGQPARRTASADTREDRHEQATDHDLTRR